MKMKASMRMKKAMRVSKIGKKWQVFKGTKVKSTGGLKKTDLTKNKAGKVVSKKKHALGAKNKWAVATKRARQALGIRGFQPVGGNSPRGKELLKKVRSFYKKYV